MSPSIMASRDSTDSSLELNPLTDVSCHNKNPLVGGCCPSHMEISEKLVRGGTNA